MTLEDSLNWLYTQKKSKKREDLSRIKYCIKALGINTNYPIIHIAGTNGKGSTATFTKSILMEANYKVGFFVSPFVISFNERIEINNDYISNENIIFYIDKLKTFAEQYSKDFNDTIPFFELTFLMALMYFEDSKIDVAIIECGLGGRLDATNCLDKTISIITNIGFDHMQTLGNSLEEIAYHKLGITRTNVPCYTCVEDSLKPYFIEYAKLNNIDISFVDQEVSNIIVSEKTSFDLDNINYICSLSGSFQAYNASLAIKACQCFDKSINYEQIQNGLRNAFWPGRFEKIKNNIIIDGAHNIHGINALVESVKNGYSNKYIKVVFTALHDKAYKEMLEKLDEVTNYYYFTTINDLRATNVEEFLNCTNKPYECGDEEQIIIKAINDLEDNEVLLITGSLHFISGARKIVLENI